MPIEIPGEVIALLIGVGTFLVLAAITGRTGGGKKK